MVTTAAVWQVSDFYRLDNDFFRPQEKKQLQNAYENFILNTKCRAFDRDEQLDDEESAQMLLQSKVQLFQLFVRTQPVNIRSFSSFHQQQQRVFVERLFYLVLNNVELTHFATFNINSIISISKELEKYQRSTNKVILNTGKLNTVVQFVLSFSSSSVSSFQLNNLFYLLLNDMNDFSGKIIDRIAEVLRVYHSMTYGHVITKQYLITTIDNAISTVNYTNPLIYPLYENFLNTSFVYKGPLTLLTARTSSSISLYTTVQNLSMTLLGLTPDDFDCDEHYLSLTAEQCYHIRLIIRHLTYLFKQYRFHLEFPLRQLNKQIVIGLINAVLFEGRTADQVKGLLDLYMSYVHGLSITNSKRLLHELLIHSSFELFVIDTIQHMLDGNRLQAKVANAANLWLSDEQRRLVLHKLYTQTVYCEIFLPFVHGACREERTVNDLVAYLDQRLSHEQEQVIDVQDMKAKLTLLP